MSAGPRGEDVDVEDVEAQVNSTPPPIFFVCVCVCVSLRDGRCINIKQTCKTEENLMPESRRCVRFRIFRELILWIRRFYFKALSELRSRPSCHLSRQTSYPRVASRAQDVISFPGAGLFDVCVRTSLMCFGTFIRALIHFWRCKREFTRRSRYAATALVTKPAVERCGNWSSNPSILFSRSA